MADGSFSKSDASDVEPQVARFLGIFAIAWFAFALLSRFPGYVHYDTAEIAMWAGLGPQLGYVKHPPLLAWLVWAYGLVVPINWLSLAALSALNLTAAAYIIWRIALITVGPARAPAAMTLYILLPFATWAAVKFNHNSILVLMWPLVIWSFLSSLKMPSLKFGIAFGAAAAAAVLAKYSSLILLAATFAVSLIRHDRLRYYCSTAPYAAVLTFAFIVAPHFYWLATDNATLSNALQPLGAGKSPALSMLLNNASFLLPVGVGFAVLARYLGLRQPTDGSPWSNGIWELAALTGISYALTLGVVSVLALRGSATWAMPVFCVLPIVLSAFLAPVSPSFERWLQRFARYAAAGVVIAAPVFVVIGFLKHEPSATDPRIEFAHDALKLWNDTIRRPLRVVAGDHRYAVTTSLESADRPAAWSEFNAYPWIGNASLKKTGVLAICRPERKKCIRDAQLLASQTGGWRCTLTRQRTFLIWSGPVIRAEVFVIKPAGGAAGLHATLVTTPPGCTYIAPPTGR